MSIERLVVKFLWLAAKKTGQKLTLATARLIAHKIAEGKEWVKAIPPRMRYTIRYLKGLEGPKSFDNLPLEERLAIRAARRKARQKIEREVEEGLRIAQIRKEQKLHAQKVDEWERESQQMIWDDWSYEEKRLERNRLGLNEDPNVTEYPMLEFETDPLPPKRDLALEKKIRLEELARQKRLDKWMVQHGMKESKWQGFKSRTKGKIKSKLRNLQWELEEKKEKIGQKIGETKKIIAKKLEPKPPVISGPQMSEWERLQIKNDVFGKYMEERAQKRMLQKKMLQKNIPKKEVEIEINKQKPKPRPKPILPEKEPEIQIEWEKGYPQRRKRALPEWEQDLAEFNKKYGKGTLYSSSLASSQTEDFINRQEIEKNSVIGIHDNPDFNDLNEIVKEKEPVKNMVLNNGWVNENKTVLPPTLEKTNLTTSIGETMEGSKGFRGMMPSMGKVSSTIGTMGDLGELAKVGYGAYDTITPVYNLYWYSQIWKENLGPALFKPSNAPENVKSRHTFDEWNNKCAIAGQSFWHKISTWKGWKWMFKHPESTLSDLFRPMSNNEKFKTLWETAKKGRDPWKTQTYGQFLQSVAGETSKKSNVNIPEFIPPPNSKPVDFNGSGGYPQIIANIGEIHNDPYVQNQALTENIQRLTGTMGMWRQKYLRARTFYTDELPYTYYEPERKHMDIYPEPRFEGISRGRLTGQIQTGTIEGRQPLFDMSTDPNIVHDQGKFFQDFIFFLFVFFIYHSSPCQFFQ